MLITMYLKSWLLCGFPTVLHFHNHFENYIIQNIVTVCISLTVRLNHRHKVSVEQYKYYTEHQFGSHSLLYNVNIIIGCHYFIDRMHVSNSKEWNFIATIIVLSVGSDISCDFVFNITKQIRKSYCMINVYSNTKVVNKKTCSQLRYNPITQSDTHHHDLYIFKFNYIASQTILIQHTYIHTCIHTYMFYCLISGWNVLFSTL